MSRPLSSLLLAPSLLRRLEQHGFQHESDVTELSPLDLARELSCSPAEAVSVLQQVSSFSHRAKRQQGGRMKAEASQSSSSSSSSSSLSSSSSSSSSSQNSDTSNQAGEEGEEASKSALQLLREKRSRTAIFTLCQKLDRMLGGGLARGEVTEVCGVPGLGKTQLAMQLAADVQIPAELSGCDGQAVYIDTEGSFTPERQAEIANGLVNHLMTVVRNPKRASAPNPRLVEAAEQLTVDRILSNIFVFRVYDHVEQMTCVRRMPQFLAEHPRVRLLVIDSVSFHFRRDFQDMSKRARVLGGMAQLLSELASKHDIAVLLTNQVTTRISNKQSYLAPALGETWAHACTNRIMLHWDEQRRRCAQLIKSPHQKKDLVHYRVSSHGIRGLRKSKSSKSSKSSSTSSTPSSSASASASASATSTASTPSASTTINAANRKRKSPPQ